MEKFNFEEICLMRIFNAANRKALRDELTAALHSADEYTEPELIMLFGSTVEKLDALTDEEFTALSTYLNVDDFYDENIDAEEWE